jgi:hypothetical protein
MVKSDVKNIETVVEVTTVNLHSNLNKNFPPGEAKVKTEKIEKGNTKLKIKAHYARLKKRLRCRPSSIF